MFEIKCAPRRATHTLSNAEWDAACTRLETEDFFYDLDAAWDLKARSYVYAIVDIEHLDDPFGPCLYIGSRITPEGLNAETDGYFGSSEPLRQRRREGARLALFVLACDDDDGIIRRFEHKLLKIYDACNDPGYYNASAGGGGREPARKAAQTRRKRRMAQGLPPTTAKQRKTSQPLPQAKDPQRWAKKAFTKWLIDRIPLYLAQRGGDVPSEEMYDALREEYSAAAGWDTDLDAADGDKPGPQWSNAFGWARARLVGRDVLRRASETPGRCVLRHGQ